MKLELRILREKADKETKSTFSNKIFEFVLKKKIFD